MTVGRWDEKERNIGIGPGRTSTMSPTRVSVSGVCARNCPMWNGMECYSRNVVVRLGVARIPMSPMKG